MENAAPFTLNEHYYRDYREKFLEYYRDARHPPQPTRPTPVISAGYQPHHAKDPHDPALHHMASARAYFQGLHHFWP